MTFSLITRSSRRRILCLAVGAVVTVAGVWVASLALAQLPSFVTALLVLALGASWCGHRIESLLFNRGATPVSYTGLRARLRTRLDSYRVPAVDGSDGAGAAETKTVSGAAVATSADDQPASIEPTVATLSEQLFQVRMLLAQERELTEVLIGEVSVERVIGEDD